MNKNFIRTNIKLVGAIAMFMLAVTMIGVGTFAWFTITQKATVADMTITLDAERCPFEMSLDYDGDIEHLNDPAVHWSQVLDVGTLLANMHSDTATGDEVGAAPLRPISTCDLVNWYTAHYDPDGNVSDFDIRELDDVANQQIVLEERGELGLVDVSANHLIYFDMWVRATSKDQVYGLKLQTPRQQTDADGTPLVDESGDPVYGDQLVDETVYGTYVLTAPEWDDTANGGAGGYVLADTENDSLISALNSFRIAFAVIDQPDPEDEDGVETVSATEYFIYEPNANVHGSAVGTISGVLDEDKKIRYNLDGDDTQNGTAVEGYSAEVSSSVDENGYLTTYVPKLKGDSYEMTVQKTIRQNASEWNKDKLAACEKGKLDSRCIKTLGAFAADTTEDDLILTYITYGEPKKVRVYFWLEGQDMDCWNQVMGSRVFANFEFIGVPKVETPEPTPEPPEPTPEP